RLRESDDPDHLGQVFFFLNRRNRLLEDLYRHAKLYVQFGMDEQEHQLMIKAVDRLREDDTMQSGGGREDPGLA
ncbi:MAG TPA: hypothetical protein VIX81_03755, partial [Gammaproteobacteria bacterium]